VIFKSIVMNLIVTISKLFKSLNNLTSIIIRLLIGSNQTIASHFTSLLSFQNISRKNLFDIYTLYYICQEFENPALIGLCRANITEGGNNPENFKSNTAASAALLHLYY